MSRRRLRPWTALALVALATSATFADDEIVLLPALATLDGPAASQRFLVEDCSGETLVGDRTASATFAVDDPKVAEVSPDGVVSPTGDGSTTLTATVDGRVADAKVTVRGFGHPRPPSFRNHVQAVLTKTGCNSGACHGAAAGKAGFRLTLRGYSPEVDYDVLTRQSLGRRIVPTAPAESLLLLKPTGALEHGGGVRFAPGSLDYRVIADWIAAGSPPPADSDARIVGIETLPRAVRLAPGDSQAFLVRATYSDGRAEDVTRWAKFGSTDETVAKVDDRGLARVEGHGEAAITVWFASRVDRATVTAPYPTSIDPAVFAEAPRDNPIDERNLAKLEALRIPPSPAADDASFLRRAGLDATGTLPSADRVDAFLADLDPDKRARLVDDLLASPEYVDYWTYKWSDLLLVSSRKLPAPAMWAFSRFVRRSVAENLPWDEFARRVVTARGNTLSEGAANYFVLHRDTIDLAESTSMAFLGLSMTCARCHNHPLEKWTQDQYYGFANLFARVRLKDGEMAGDVVVSASAEGDVRHPRTGVIVPPTPLDAEPVESEARGDRREALADWLARPDNPYFGRAIVNRVWANFFGRGLVDPEDDLRATNPPSDPALMDWLVADLLAHDFDVKHLIRTIMTSAVYARSSGPVAGNETDATFLSHYPVKRLPAEVILDAVSKVTRVPTAFAGYPAGWRALQLPDAKVESTFLASFGRPERLTTCSCERTAEPSMAQALHLANGSTLNDKLRSDSGAVAAATGTADARVIDDLFRSALSRSPTAAERDRLSALLAEAAEGLEPDEAKAARRQAIEDLYWGVLTSNEFLFNH